MYESEREQLHREIRGREAQLVTKYLPSNGRLLEVGAGGGFQADYFSRLGFDVDAIDLESSPHIKNAVFPVQIFDGRTIPYPDSTFDVVFTSNVLEHVPWCKDLLLEMKRVLKENGLMIHVVPTPSWRIWTSVAHYYRNVQLLAQFAKKSQSPQSEPALRPESHTRKTSVIHIVQSILFPFRHGAHGNWLTEVYFFSRVRWSATFRAAHLKLVRTVPTGIFYTGYGIPGLNTAMETRTKLARWVGSSTVIFVLTKSK